MATQPKPGAKKRNRSGARNIHWTEERKRRLKHYMSYPFIRYEYIGILISGDGEYISQNMVSQAIRKYRKELDLPMREAGRRQQWK